MSMSAGTGSPIWFRCSACRRRCHLRSEDPIGCSCPLCKPLPYQLTGRWRTRGGKRGRLGTRNEPVSVEYTCECGHTGWSSHRDLVRQALAAKTPIPAERLSWHLRKEFDHV